MSEAPDPGIILDIVSSFDQGTSPDAFLLKSVSAIPAHIPQARFARVYRLYEGKAVLQAASDTEQPAGAYRHLQATPLFAEAVRNETPAIANGLWVGPLHSGPALYGLLEIGVSDELTPGWSKGLHLLAQHLGQSLYTVATRDLVRRQANAAMELTRCTTLGEMAGAIGRHMLPGGQFATINLLEYGDNGALSGLKVMASANQEQTFDPAQTVPLTINDLGQPLAESFINSEPALVNDISSNNTMSAPFRKWLAGNKVEALLSLPLRRGEQTFGVLAINSAHGPLLLTEDEMLAYRSLADQISVVFQNLGLLQEAQVSAADLSKQVEALQHINQLATALNAVQDEPRLFAQSAEMIVTTVKADHCGIVLVDAGAETGTVAAEYPAGSALGLKIPWAGNPLAGLVTQEGKTAIIHDAASDERLIEESRQFFASAGISGCIFVPLKMQGKVVGSVGLDIYHNSRSISPEMVEIAEIMTTQIGVALQNIRLLNDTQRHAQQLQRIANFNQSVQATLDTEAIFNIALTESAQMLPLDQMRILLYDPAQAQLRTVAEYEQGQTRITLKDGAPLGLDDTTEGRVWRTREFVYLPTETRARDPHQPFKLEPGSDMIAALQSHGRTLGVVSVSSNQTYAFGETDFAVFRQMADQLTVAIENAEAYTQSQRQARNEALVNEIATRLQRQTDIQNMLDITMNELGKALGARRARIRLATEPDDHHE